MKKYSQHISLGITPEQVQSINDLLPTHQFGSSADVIRFIITDWCREEPKRRKAYDKKTNSEYRRTMKKLRSKPKDDDDYVPDCGEAWDYPGSPYLSEDDDIY